jgi:hypothetical protein
MPALDFAATELRGSPAARGAALGGVAAAALRGGGAGGRLALAGGVVAAALELSATARHNRLTREVRNAAERVSLTAWAEHPPLLGEGAVDADFARVVLDAVQRTSGDVVELGAGVSTALVAQAVRGTGRRIWSVEHDDGWAEACLARLRRFGLGEPVTLVRAPLADQPFDGYRARWYDRAALDVVPRDVGLLVVDGPPYLGGRERWPALEVLDDRLRADAVVLADDGRRRHETLMARRWAARSGLALRWVDTAKGAWMLQREERPRLRGLPLRVARRLNPHPAGHGLAAVPR